MFSWGCFLSQYWIGDSISNSCSVITAVHASCASNVDPHILKLPPLVALRPLSSFIWMPFDQSEHALGYGKDDTDFNKDDSCKMTANVPKSANLSMSPKIVIKYHLHPHDQDSSILAGLSVISWEIICPPCKSCPNQNLFQQFFSIKFHHNNHTYVCAISTYEFARCFGLVDNIQYQMSHDRHKFGLDAAMPGRSSSWIFNQVHSHLVYLHDANCKIFLPNQFAAPAATIQTLVNDTICTCIPSQKRWVQAYTNDTELCTVRDLSASHRPLGMDTIGERVASSLATTILW